MKYTELKIGDQFKQYLIEEDLNFVDGYHYVFKFPNRYGASVIKHRGSYGQSDDLFELAVLLEDDLCYDTEITGDVIGRLTNEDVMSLLKKIMNLSEV